MGCTIMKVYYDYEMDVRNHGLLDLQDVGVTSEKGFRFDFGYVSKGAIASLGSPQPTQPNDIYTLTLEYVDGSKAEKIVDLREKIKTGYKGIILFIINENNELVYELKER
jgi:hypothetical protein